MNKNRKIIVKGTEVLITKLNNQDFISLTDMCSSFGDDSIIYNWMKTRFTVDFLGIWESLNNPDFKGGEFETFRNEAGRNSFHLTPKKWIEATNAIGIVSKAGRYGGTYAHIDIATSFASWLSPEFQLYLIKEFHRLKEQESNVYHLEWNAKRLLSKANYKIHTDAIKVNIIPFTKPGKEVVVYSTEADLLNLAVFGYTAQQWREKYPDETVVCHNIRECANIVQLAVLANCETKNAMFITEGLDKEIRFNKLRSEAIRELEILSKYYPDPKKMESPNKQKLQEIAATKQNEDQALSFGDAITMISRAGKPNGRPE